MTIDRSKFNATEKMEIDFDASKVKLRDSLFYYCKDNYFKGMLVRLKVINLLQIKLKVYLR
jgi:hypothetical protein